MKELALLNLIDFVGPLNPLPDPNVACLELVEDPDREPGSVRSLSEERKAGSRELILFLEDQAEKLFEEGYGKIK